MKLTFPLKYKPYLTQAFGANKEFYSQYKIGGVSLKGHEGADYRAPVGTEVVACDDGFCQEVLDQGTVGYGRYIKIVHAWGESVYAHLQSFKVKQGDQVRAGQTIALADSTGNSTASHLHFGIRINPHKRDDGWGGYSDPEPYLFGEVSEELDMPKWAKNLKPFFIENNLKDDQIESTVREAFSNKKILSGFIEKWSEKFQCDKDLGAVEKEIQDLLDTEDRHVELISTAEQVVGHFETEKALRDALRAVKSDLENVSETNQELVKDNETLRNKRVLNRYEIWELVTALGKMVFTQILGLFRKKK